MRVKQKLVLIIVYTYNNFYIIVLYCRCFDPDLVLFNAHLVNIINIVKNGYEIRSIIIIHLTIEKVEKLK